MKSTKTVTPEEKAIILSKMSKLANILPCVRKAFDDARMTTVRLITASNPEEYVGIKVMTFGTQERKERARELMATNFCESFELIDETSTSLTYSL